MIGGKLNLIFLSACQTVTNNDLNNSINQNSYGITITCKFFVKSLLSGYYLQDVTLLIVVKNNTNKCIDLQYDSAK